MTTNISQHDVVENNPETIDEEESGFLLRIQKIEAKLNQTEENNDSGDDSRPMDEDTYSIMILSEMFTKPWWFGFTVFLVQLCTMLLIFYERFILLFDTSSEFQEVHVPYKVPFYVTLGQLIALTMGVASCNDFFTSILNISMACVGNTLLACADSVKKLPPNRIMFPAVLQFIVGFLSLITVLELVILSTDIVSLFQDFTALQVVIQFDNLAFWFVDNNFLASKNEVLVAGKAVKAHWFNHQGMLLSEKSNDKVVQDDFINNDTVVRNEKKVRGPRPWHLYISTLFVMPLFGIWITVVVMQKNRAILANELRECKRVYGDELFQNVMNDRCDFDYNNKICDYDGGDCAEFNSKFPDCDVKDVTILGNGVCDAQANTLQCYEDGGDCTEINRQNTNCTAPTLIFLGDGECRNEYPYNTLECYFDGGDCIEFNRMYPKCTALNAFWIGDETCHDISPYNTEECGFDGGDCLESEDSDESENDDES